MMQQNTFKQTEVGGIPEDWAVYRLSDVVDIIGGGTPKTRVEEYWNGDIPWLSVVDFNGELRWVHDTDKTITQRGLEESSTKLLKKGQLIISARGTVGEIAQLGKDMAFNQSCYGLNGKEMLINDFLYCLLKYNVAELKTKTHGSVFDTITRKTFEQINVALPPILEQKRIAKILSDLDNKIELNRQINQTLESMAQAIFKSWFVNFEPVKAKIAALESGEDAEGVTCAAMRAISGKTDDELDKMKGGQPEDYAQLKTTAELFPSAMQDSELGEVPEGWKVGVLSDLIEFNPKRTLKKGIATLYLDMKNVPTVGHLADEVILREMGSGTKFINGDTLLARITPCLENGKTAYVDFLSDGQVGWGSTEYIVMRPKNAIPASFGYFVARLDSFRQFAIQSMTGTSGRQRANADALKALPWIKFPTEIIQAFDKIGGATLEQAKSRGDENKTLAKLRDTLLPKLISGEIQVKVER